jgi:hypothetical protein
MANLAKASVIGGISVRASLMKRKEAAQRQTMVPANVRRIRVLFVVTYLPVLYLPSMLNSALSPLELILQEVPDSRGGTAEVHSSTR